MTVRRTPPTLQRCDFCYRPAVRVFAQPRRSLWQVVMRRPRRRAAACATLRCEVGARKHLATRRGGLL